MALKRKIPSPPKHISAQSKEFWRKLLKQYALEDDVAAMQYLNEGCEALDRAHQAAADARKHGPVIKDRWGQPKPNPACQVERDARAQFLQCMKMLNLDIEPLNDRPGRPAGS